MDTSSSSPPVPPNVEEYNANKFNLDAETSEVPGIISESARKGGNVSTNDGEEPKDIMGESPSFPSIENDSYSFTSDKHSHNRGDGTLAMETLPINGDGGNSSDEKENVNDGDGMNTIYKDEEIDNHDDNDHYIERKSKDGIEDVDRNKNLVGNGEHNDNDVHNRKREDLFHDGIDKEEDINTVASVDSEGKNIDKNDKNGDKEYDEIPSILSKNLLDGFYHHGRFIDRTGSRARFHDTNHLAEMDKVKSSQESTTRINVNFIDPTSTSSLAASSGNVPTTISSPSTSSPVPRQQKHKALGINKWLGKGNDYILSPLAKTKKDASLLASINSYNLYQHFLAAFQTYYGSSLHGVVCSDPLSSSPFHASNDDFNEAYSLGNSYSNGENDNNDNKDSSLSPSRSTRTSKVAIPHISIRPTLVGTPDAAPSSVADPISWHTLPHCHVYLAACHSVEHYRTRVRPALRAFLSQFLGSGSGDGDAARDAATRASGRNEGLDKGGRREVAEAAIAAAGSAADAVTGGGGQSSLDGGRCPQQYIIILVPVGLEPLPEEVSESTVDIDGSRLDEQGGMEIGGSRSLRSRLGVPSSSGGNSKPYDPASLPPPGNEVLYGSKETKELLSKFRKDFPLGRTCVLSTLIERHHSSQQYRSSPPPPGPLQNQEWKAFLQALSDAIVCGFRDSVGRYDTELRRLENLANVIPETSAHGDITDVALKSNAINDGQNSLSNDERRSYSVQQYFLVRESLAFTYEQMQMHREAVREYKALEGFVQNGAFNGKDYDVEVADRNSMDESENENNDEEDVAMKIAAETGDIVRFRETMHSSTLGQSREEAGIRMRTAVASQSQLYIFSRITDLLFRSGRPVDVLESFHSFLMSDYKTRNAKSGKSGYLLSCQTIEWVVGACWDFKIAYEEYYGWTRHDRDGDCVSDAVKKDSATIPSLGIDKSEEARAAARKLVDILDFGRMRLLDLGDVKFGHHNVVREALSDRPKDLERPWHSWSIKTENKNGNARNLNDEGIASEEGQTLKLDSNSVLKPFKSSFSQSSNSCPSFWLRKLLSSISDFSEGYINISEELVRLNVYTKRYRGAARILGEIAEVRIHRSEHEEAVKVLLESIDHSCNASSNMWGELNCWRLFRLASCQRISGTANDYLQTLTLCFGHHLSTSMPSKASLLLQRDMEDVVNSPSINNEMKGMSPFLECSLTVEPTKLGKAVGPLGLIHRKLVRHICCVGDTVLTKLRIFSHLPGSIVIDALKLLLITAERYEALHTDDSSDNLTEDNAFRVLNVQRDPKIEIQSGWNDFQIPWTPMSPGWFLLDSVHLTWGNATFHHDCHDSRKPILGVEVTPSKPTQTIELNPLFLIPGHEQDVRIVFHSGLDIVRGGTLELMCSYGLQISPPNIDPSYRVWGDSCMVNLDPCAPNSKVTIVTSVKSDLTKRMTVGDEGDGNNVVDDDVVQIMQAKVTTFYHHGLYKDPSEIEGNDKEPEAPQMTSVLEGIVTTLDRPALTVHKVNALPLTEKDVIISITIHCNTPVPFSLKEWNISLPPPLVLSQENCDMNEGLFQYPVVEGEELFFGFKCDRLNVGTTTDASQSERPVMNVVLQDDFGKTFRQVLPLNIDAYYNQMKVEDENDNKHLASAELKIISNEGMVSSPVSFTYHIDTSMMTAPKRRLSMQGRSAMMQSPNEEAPTAAPPSLLFHICGAEVDWILGGKIRGCLDHTDKSSPFQLDFVGIPTRAGVIKRFPSLTLTYCTDSKNYLSHPPIIIHARFPDSFMALPYCSHMALAYPTSSSQ